MAPPRSRSSRLGWPGVLALALAAGCDDPAAGDPDGGPPGDDAQPEGFVEDTRIAPEDSPALSKTGEGIVVLDYDNDGDRDLLVATGVVYLPKTRVALLRNDGTGGFTDVAVEAGLTAERVYATPAAFDYDNDGDVDLYLCAQETAGDGRQTFDGFDVLYRNDGDGTFTDVSEAAGINPAARFNTETVGVADVDHDGLVDIYVATDLDVDVSTPPVVTNEPDQLFHNNGDGTFTEEATARGIVIPEADVGYTLASLFLDHDADGDPDLLVAMDFGYLLLFENDGTGHFTDATDAARLREVGWGHWMAVSPTDLDGDGDFDVVADNIGSSFLTFQFPPFSQLPADWHPLAAALRNEGDGTFTDVAAATPLRGFTLATQVINGVSAAPDTLQMLPWGWGLSAFDYDNDGREDLYQTGSTAFSSTFGIIGTREHGAYPGLLARREEGGGFLDVTDRVGVADVRDDGYIFGSWGHTFGDLDGDGALEVVVGNLYLSDLPGQVRIFRNLGNRNHWVAFKLQGTTSNRDGIGATIRLFRTEGEPPQLRGSFVTGWSYPRDALYFGLGDATSVARVEITWPSGVLQHLFNVEVDQIVEVTER